MTDQEQRHITNALDAVHEWEESMGARRAPPDWFIHLYHWRIRVAIDLHGPSPALNGQDGAAGRLNETLKAIGGGAALESRDNGVHIELTIPTNDELEDLTAKVRLIRGRLERWPSRV